MSNVTIRIGASHDTVTVKKHGQVLEFDRAEMRRNNKDNSSNGINALRRNIVNDMFIDEPVKGREKRLNRRLNKKRYDKAA